MEFETIELVKKNNLATLTLNRPERSNAINMKMMEELVVAVEDIAQDDDMRAMLLTGAGKAFCGGADLDIMPGGGNVENFAKLGVLLQREIVILNTK